MAVNVYGVRNDHWVMVDGGKPAGKAGAVDVGSMTKGAGRGVTRMLQFGSQALNINADFGGCIAHGKEAGGGEGRSDPAPNLGGCLFVGHKGFCT